MGQSASIVQSSVVMHVPPKQYESAGHEASEVQASFGVQVLMNTSQIWPDGHSAFLVHETGVTHW